MHSAAKEFDKSRLKPTETAIRTVDGRVFKEKRDESGHTSTEQVEDCGLGFVGGRLNEVGDVAPGLKMALKDFNKLKLKPTDTKILTVDGRILKETRNSSGIRVVEQLQSGEQGYIGDMKSDLQVGEVLPGLIMGSQDIAHEQHILDTYHVTHILNAASMVENLFPDKIVYKNIRILDTPEEKIREKFDEAHTFIDQGRKLGCVLVHCNAGISRAATLVISYLMKTEKMSFNDAYDFLKEKRPRINPNPGFLFQLKEYENELKTSKEK